MTIGFGNGDYWKVYENDEDRFSKEYSQIYRARGLADALELHCRDEATLDYLAETQDLDYSDFLFLSLHAPDFHFADNEDSRRVLSKLELLVEKFGIDNCVFHTDKVGSWKAFAEYQKIPVSIENMDDRKDSGQTVDDVRAILNKHDFSLTLDLQHCFVNDASMKLATDFQREFRDRVVEYHISGYEEKALHYPLFKTKQNKIIESLIYKETPIIIESTFGEMGEHEKELQYIKDRLK